MASYCERDEIAIWGVNEAALADVAPASMTKAIAGASDLIDSYISARFVLPLVSWGYAIRRAAAIISAYDLIGATRGYMPTQEDEKDPLRTRYEDTLQWLDEIKSGSVTPVAVGSGTGAGGSNGTGSDAVNSSTAIVTSNTQRGWFSDSPASQRGPFTGGR